MRVLVFGDSITYGRLDTQGGWANRLRLYYDSKFSEHGDYPSIYNLGISGDTAEGVLKRFTIETEARSDDDLSFIIAIGTNDSVLNSGEPRFTEDQYKKNLQDILGLAKKYSDTVMLVGLLPVLEKLTTPIPWRKERHYTNERIQLFDHVMEQVALDANVRYLPLYDPFNAKVQEKEGLLPDGLHPNNEGHELIFKLVQPTLDQVLKT